MNERKKVNLPKPKSLKKICDKSPLQLEKILDRWFSYFIRLRNADEFGMVGCITCNKRIYWKDADCGHYVKRGRSACRFNEQNCGAQCRHCNRQRNGEEQAHRIYIDKFYGDGTAGFLKLKGKKPFTMTRDEYIEKIIYYKEQLKIIKVGSNP